jgi:hypothetical protein
MEVYVGSSSRAPSSPRLGTILVWRPVDCFTLHSLYPREHTEQESHWFPVSFWKFTSKNHWCCWDSKPKSSSLWLPHHPDCSVTNVNEHLFHVVLLQNYELSIYFFQACKDAHFAIRTNLLPPFSTGNFEAWGACDTPSYVYENTRHFPDRHLENENRQNSLTDKFKKLLRQ